MLKASTDMARSYPDVGQEALRQLRDGIVVGISKLRQLLSDIRSHLGARDDFLQVAVAMSLQLVAGHLCLLRRACLATQHAR